MSTKIKLTQNDLQYVCAGWFIDAKGKLHLTSREKRFLQNQFPDCKIQDISPENIIKALKHGRFRATKCDQTESMYV